MEYFYASPTAIQGDTLFIEGEEFVHLTHVMRKTRGETVMVVDGAGTAYEVTIRETADRRAVCTVLSVHPRLHEPAREVHLGVAVLKNTSNYDLLVEKCTELGVRSITPLLTERTIPRHARPDRWQKIALSAMKQSGRCILPTVHPLKSLGEFLQWGDPNWLKLIPHEKIQGAAIVDVVELSGSDRIIALCIGPEGGFSEEEVRTAVREGFRPVGLGPTRLRTETAAIVATAASVESRGRP